MRKKSRCGTTNGALPFADMYFTGAFSNTKDQAADFG